MASQIGQQRLYHQRIIGQQHKTAKDIVEWMGAIQAQDYKQALWAIGARMQTSRVGDVEAAIEAGEIVRTWSQRGTIHFVPANDIKWMLQLCASRVLSGHYRRMKQLELTDETMIQSRDIFEDSLQGNHAMTRTALFALLEAKGISTTGQRGYHILWHLAHEGVICMSTQAGRDTNFVLVDEWIPDAVTMTEEEALAHLVKTYFLSHGPATEHDFAKWSGLNLTDTRRGLNMNHATLSSFMLDDVEFWFDPTFENPTTTQSRVQLLPAYDEYIIGYQDRQHVLNQHYDKVVSSNGVFRPMIVCDGEVVGIWKRTIKKTSVDVTLHPFDNLDHIKDAIIAEAERYGQFMGLPERIIEA